MHAGINIEILEFHLITGITRTVKNYQIYLSKSILSVKKRETFPLSVTQKHFSTPTLEFEAEHVCTQQQKRENARQSSCQPADFHARFHRSSRAIKILEIGSRHRRSSSINYPPSRLHICRGILRVTNLFLSFLSFLLSPLSTRATCKRTVLLLEQSLRISKYSVDTIYI